MHTSNANIALLPREYLLVAVTSRIADRDRTLARDMSAAEGKRLRRLLNVASVPQRYASAHVENFVAKRPRL